MPPRWLEIRLSSSSSTRISWARYLIRMAEMDESLKIIKQTMKLLKKDPGPVMVEDKKIAWPAQLTIGPDGMGNSL